MEMWKKIRAADVDAAKGQLSRKRTETLRTQAEELESLDAQLRDIDTFERVVAAFFEEYMNEARLCASVSEQSTAASLSDPDEPCTQAPQNEPSLALQIRQSILPSFKVMPRARAAVKSEEPSRQRLGRNNSSMLTRLLCQPLRIENGSP
jgi:hypothetical protein